MFSATFIERPRFSFVISILIVLIGLISIVKLPIALYPEVTPPQISVSAYYPGASSEVIAKMVGVLIIPLMYVLVQSLYERFKNPKKLT